MLHHANASTSVDGTAHQASSCFYQRLPPICATIVHSNHQTPRIIRLPSHCRQSLLPSYPHPPQPPGQIKQKKTSGSTRHMKHWLLSSPQAATKTPWLLPRSPYNNLFLPTCTTAPTTPHTKHPLSSSLGCSRLPCAAAKACGPHAHTLLRVFKYPKFNMHSSPSNGSLCCQPAQPHTMQLTS